MSVAFTSVSLRGHENISVIEINILMIDFKILNFMPKISMMKKILKIKILDKGSVLLVFSFTSDFQYGSVQKYFNIYSS